MPENRIQQLQRERSTVEEALRMSRNVEGRLRYVVNAMPAAMLMINPEGQIVWSNKADQTLFGYTSKELWGMDVEKVLPQIVHDDKGINLQAASQRPRVTEEGITDDLYAVHKSGRRMAVELGLSPVQIDGRTFVLVSAVDISRRKRAEKVLSVEKQRIERFAARTQNALNAIQKELTIAKRLSSIGTLAATVAHELRNPLGVIRTALYNVRRKRQNPGLDKHLDNIDKKISESEQIISNLLNYARIKLPNFEPVQLDELLDNVTTAMAELFKNDNIEIVRNLKSIRGRVILADSLQLTEVFNNMLGNAFQALPASGGRVTVSADATPQMVRIHVADNGAGIDAKDRERIFEPFFTRKSKGTGLGLSICAELVQLHFGDIHVDSEKGKGARFTISLPWGKDSRNSRAAS